MKLKKLYQRALKNKVNTWEIEVIDNRYRTITGFEGFKLTTSDWTICATKSYCTAEEQALKEAQALYNKKLELGYFEDINDIDKSTLFKPMLANKYEDVDITFPCYTQKKYDGIRCIVKKDGMWTRNGKSIVSCPHIFDEIKPIFEKYPNLVLDGELYNHNLKHDFNKIVSLVKKTKPKEEDLIESKKIIEYHIYDIPSLNFIFSQRLKGLRIIHNMSLLYSKMADTYFISNQEELDSYYESFLNEGYEGQMVRVSNSFYENKRSKSLLKRKDFMDEEFIILDILEGSGKLANKAGMVVFNTNEGVRVESAINGNHEYLEEIWLNKDNIIGKKATVKYFNKTEDGSLRFPKVIFIDRDSYE
jgi:DNA ligase-1